MIQSLLSVKFGSGTERGREQTETNRQTDRERERDIFFNEFYRTNWPECVVVYLLLVECRFFSLLLSQ